MEITIIPFMMYLAWQIFYLLIIEVLLAEKISKDPDLDFSLRYHITRSLLPVQEKLCIFSSKLKIPNGSVTFVNLSLYFYVGTHNHVLGLHTCKNWGSEYFLNQPKVPYCYNTNSTTTQLKSWVWHENDLTPPPPPQYKSEQLSRAWRVWAFWGKNGKIHDEILLLALAYHMVKKYQNVPS